jgi:uncharacterized membrane protein YjjB (DUF3815 family)
MGFADYILNIVFSFIATIGFCVVFSIPKRQMLFCGLLGIISWIVYILLKDPVGVVAATFFSTVCIVLLARIFAVVRKCPVVLLLVPGIIPLAPGSGIYYTAYYFVTNDMSKAAEFGFLTVKIAFAIVLGIILVIAIPVKKAKKKSGDGAQKE